MSDEHCEHIVTGSVQMGVEVAVELTYPYC